MRERSERGEVRRRGNRQLRRLQRASGERDDLLVLDFLLLVRSEFLADWSIDSRSDELLRCAVEDEAAVGGHANVAAVQSTNLLASGDDQSAIDALL